LKQLAEPIRRLAESAFKVHVIFNNNYANYAQHNAAELMEILEGKN
jgi:uncharacterized protein YecE (DUF72 family)